LRIVRLRIVGTCKVSGMAIEEREVELEAAVGNVAGSLVRPGAATGAVLLSGGGPFDRDGTSGPNAPLRDIALGLAERGIATLRFDKLSYTGASPTVTMTEEYVPHALAAVRALRDAGAERVFVVGHSMGGKIAPRVAAAESGLAGLAMLAADAVPMHLAAVRVARYLAAHEPGEATAQLVEAVEAGAAALEAPELPAEEPMMFGYSGTFWADVLAYDPVATARSLDLPMLFVQGGRDYQVTVADDLALWRAGLEDRANVAFHVHESANHLFFPGAGPSGPAEYAVHGHVDPAVIAEVADWIERA
jgi:uncharacterized protein